MISPLRPMRVMVVVTAIAAMPFLQGGCGGEVGRGGGDIKIAFVSDRDGNEEIYVMNVDGSGQTNLTNNATADITPAFSPDGSKIAFASLRDGNWEIYVMNADGTGVTRLTNNAAWDYSPVFSPNGSELAFARNPGTTGAIDSDWSLESCIYVMNADGTGVTRLTTDTAWDGSPAFSPDGSKIVFESDRDTTNKIFSGNFEIYIMNANGSEQTRLTNNTTLDFGAVFSPDGSKIAFFSDRDANPEGPYSSEIYIMTAGGTGVTRLTNNAASDDFPAFSPDGSKIAFASNRDGNKEIYIMNVDGTEQTRLTNSLGKNENPSFPLRQKR